MAELVTMVFTDLVSSTAVKQQMPGRDLAERNAHFFNDILQPHRQRVEETLPGAHGRVVSTQGDGYFLVFTDLLQAVRWCVDLLRDHQARPIPSPLGNVQVKIALHVGSPLLDGDNFIGHEVDYAARIGALCHGDQILVSETVAALLRDAHPADLSLHAHGGHALKGVGTVPIFELLYDGRAPLPLKSEKTPTVELPPLPESVVGREAMLEQLLTAVERGGLVVLRGEGGMGKTTLALTVAHRLAEHVPVAWLWGEQSPSLEDCLRDVALAWFGDPHAHLSVEACQQRIHQHAEETRALLVLDNFETVAADTGLQRWLMTFRGKGRVLVTTREVPPSLRGTIMPVHELTNAEAVQLFCDRLQVYGGPLPSDPKVVQELCQMVGNAPLAVELLAGRAARLPLSRLLQRLQTSLRVLDSGGDPSRPERHQSASACFEVSYATLSSAAQKLLTHLAVWPDGIGLEALHTLKGEEDWDEAAEELVSASVWRLEGERYEVHPMVRQFALEALGPDQRQVMHDAISAMARIAQAKAARLVDSTSTSVAVAFAWFDEEWTNLLYAIDQASKMSDCDLVVALAESVTEYWKPRGLARDMEEVYAQVLAARRRQGDAAGEAATLGHLADVCEELERPEEAGEYMRQALAAKT
ncbi:MAG TPA: AAA family ATPase [Candidatus Xenobia bacterium]|jgi:class 3 adenylate cyclase/predicted ATPase